MKKITLTFVAVISAVLVLAQTPQAFKYQAVVRDNLGEIVANQEINFRFSIRDEIPVGPILYQETQLEFTDAYGRANLEIGRGTPTIGVFEDIDWGDDERYLEVELDLEGGSAFVSMGTTQLLAVPYALYSETTGDNSRWLRNLDDLYYLNGKVGIGTSNPEYKLTVSDDIYSHSSYFGVSKTNFTDVWNNLDGSIAMPLGYIGSQGSWRSSWVWNGYRNSGNTWTSLGLNGYTSAYAIELGYDGIYFRTASEVLTGNSPPIRMFINNIGNVGIGTSAPTGRLHTSIDNFGRHLKCERTGLNPSYYEIYLAGDIIYHRSDVDQVIQIDSMDIMTVVASGNVGIGTTSPETSSLLDLNSDSKGFLPPRMIEAQRNAISNPAAGLVVWCTNCGSDGELQVYNGSAWTNMIGGAALTTPAIGVYYQGGVIFYLDGSGGGLICTVSDQSSGAEWGCWYTGISGAQGTAIGTGAQNTIQIETVCTTYGTAADYCANLSLNGYDDWFLPSQDELNEMFQNQAAIDATATANGGDAFEYNFYWSSSEADACFAWGQDFLGGYQYAYEKSEASRVRAVRAF